MEGLIKSGKMQLWGDFMKWFGGTNLGYGFEMFSSSHFAMLGIFFAVSFAIFKYQETLKRLSLRKLEIGLAISLIIWEAGYHSWLYMNGLWKLRHSIPAELCNISLFLTILLLLTGRKLLFELLFFTAILGASQALATPVLYYDFPHFRFFHFFWTHMLMIWAVLYYMWVKGIRPTWSSVKKAVIFLNLLVPFVMLLNELVGGNYMFLSHKPKTASLLDFLGPHPWYILTLETIFIASSLLIWWIFRDRKI